MKWTQLRKGIKICVVVNDVSHVGFLRSVAPHSLCLDGEDGRAYCFSRVETQRITRVMVGGGYRG